MRTGMCWATAMVLIVSSIGASKSPDLPAVPNVDGRVATPQEVDFFLGQTREPPTVQMPAQVIVPVDLPKRPLAPLPVSSPSTKAIEMAVLHLLSGELADAARWLTASLQFSK